MAIPNYIHIQDEKPTGVDGGETVAGSYLTRDLNTIVTDEFGDVISLVANQVILAAGTYIARIRTPAAFIGRHQARLQNITTASILLEGTSQFSSSISTGSIATPSLVVGQFVVAAGQVLEVQHQVQFTRSAVAFDEFGLGVASNFPGTVEIYTQMILKKIS